MKRMNFLLAFLLLGFAVVSRPGFAEDAPVPTPPPAAVAPAAATAKPQEQTVDLREDRIKSIQKKNFLKRHRWEIGPSVGLSLNDAFYQKIGGGAAAAYHPVDSLGFEIMGMYTATVQTDMGGFFQQANEALPKTSLLRYCLMGSILWSPIYGKLSLFTDDIVMFDAYLLGGFGMAYTETGAKFASNIGLGLRYFMTSWLVLKIEVRDLIYTETFPLETQRTKFSDIQNHVLLGIGVTFFFPFDFEYDYQ
jgi:outer membrane beta-barrel protein